MNKDFHVRNLQYFLEYTKEIAKISFFINDDIKMKGGFIACESLVIDAYELKSFETSSKNPTLPGHKSIRIYS